MNYYNDKNKETIEYDFIFFINKNILYYKTIKNIPIFCHNKGNTIKILDN